MASAIDPVCKMEVDTGSPPGGQSEHQGTTYYFCAPGCKVVFDQDPDRFLTDGGQQHDHTMGSSPTMGAPAGKPGFFARLFGRR